MKAIKNIFGYIFSDTFDQNVCYYCKMMSPALIAITVMVLFKSWIIFGNYHFSDETLLDSNNKLVKSAFKHSRLFNSTSAGR